MEKTCLPYSYSEVKGLDYDEMFASVITYDSLRLIIALALHLGLDMSQVDIKSAFLNGDLNEEVWMMPTPSIGLDGKVLHLYKSLYGLKQASLAWFKRLSTSAKKISVASYVIVCHRGIGVSWYLLGVSQVSPGVF